MRIFILGAAKSGTSGLFYCVKDSAERHFGWPFQRLFEPINEADILAAPAGPIVCKTLLERFRTFNDPAGVLGRFDKRIVIIRDPRDNVISRLMWMIATRFGELDTSGAEAMLALLGQKERDSNSISVRALINQAAAILGGSQAADQSARSAAYAILDYMDQHENLHLLRYEDFVAHRVDGLQSYLGFELRRDFKMPPKATRILRTGREGNWRSWFLAEDHDFFVAGEAAKFQRLGYTDERPSHVSTAIDADEVTGYVARVQAILNDPHRGARRGRRAKPQSENL